MSTQRRLVTGSCVQLSSLFADIFQTINKPPEFNKLNLICNPNPKIKRNFYFNSCPSPQNLQFDLKGLLVSHQHFFSSLRRHRSAGPELECH